MTTPTPAGGPVGGSAVLERAKVELSEPQGAYRRLLVSAPETCRRSRAGQFVAIAAGEDLVHPLRRFFTIVDAQPARARIELLIAATGPATAWIGRQRVGDVLDVFGPLGQPFPHTKAGQRVVFIGGGHGGAGICRAAREAASTGSDVHVVLGAANEPRLFDPDRFRGFASTVTVMTDDGSAGQKGSVLEPVRALLESGISLAYACGPMAMLAAVSRTCAERRATCWVACEVAMACAYGVCMSCVLPMVASDGGVKMRRACLEGPVLRSDRVRWADVGTIPVGCVGG